MAGVLAGAPIHSTVVAALRTAAAKRVPDPVDTHSLLAALMRADASGDWSRICLNAGDVDAVENKLVVDRAGGGPWHWENIRLTVQCAIALDVAGRLATRYRLWPIPVGLVVLGLIADHSSGAAQALRDGMHRRELLALVQSDVLGVTLSGIDYTLPTVLNEATAVHRNPPSAYHQPPPAARPYLPAPGRRPVSNLRSAKPPRMPERGGAFTPTAVLLALLAVVFVFVFAVTMHDQPVDEGPQLPPATFIPRLTVPTIATIPPLTLRLPVPPSR
ncbi:hypothetical protein ACWELJ_13100 [Nocardia sp. NPDC004582]